jgi:putative Mg2+ transporter-C (MgtC) family protein
MHELDILWRLGLALVLSSAIGVEREIRQKTAGLSTYTLVGVGSAAFMLVSIFGFSDAVNQAHVSLDPSRVAAQIVSGIGFIGGGIIFVRRDSVRGLTTAAGVWVTAAVGMACGGNLPLVALATTVVYFVVAYAYPQFVPLLPRSRDAPSELHLEYLDGQGILREILTECARRGFSISDVSIKHEDNSVRNGANGHRDRHVSVELEVRGRTPVAELAADLNEMNGIVNVHAGDTSALTY